MSYDVSVISCPNYEKSNVDCALFQALSAIGGLDWIKSGMRILIKTNLVAPKRPDTHATTHPQMLLSLAALLLKRGATVIVGDSPGGLFNLPALTTAYSICGLNALKDLGVILNTNFETGEADIENAVQAKHISYTKYIDDCDAVISFAKLKTHGLTGMTGAVKNLFGIIPGTIKAEYHYRYPDITAFSNMLVDIETFVKPTLSIIDGVWGMEGNGPTSGTPKFAGVIIASKSAHTADVVASKVMGIDPLSIHTVQCAVKRGLLPSDLSEITVSGEIIPKNFKYTKSTAPSSFMDKIPFGGLIAKILQNKPALVPDLCVKCGKCKEACPVNAIKLSPLPKINRQKCIKCFCCQEFCPTAAMKVHRSAIARILNK